MADDNSKKLMTLDTFAYALQRIEARYQVKESGKGLSTNDFTDEYKNKLDNIAPDEIIATEEEVDEVIDEVFGEDDEPTEDAGAAEDSDSGDGVDLDETTEAETGGGVDTPVIN